MPSGSWTEDDLAKIRGVIGDHELPYFDFSTLDTSYSLRTAINEEGVSLLVLTAENFAYENIDDVLSTWVGDVFKDLTSSYTLILPTGMKYLEGTYSDGTMLEIDMFVLDANDEYISSGSGTFHLNIIPIAISTSSWTEALSDLNELIVSDLSLASVSEEVMPEPIPAASYVVRSVYDSSYGKYYPQLKLHGVTSVAYLTQLEGAGWTAIEGVAETGTYLVSPDISLGITATYAENVLTLDFVSNTLYPSWPSEVISALLAQVVGTSGSVTLPEPSFSSSVNFVQIDDEIDVNNSFSVHLYGSNWVNTYTNNLLNAGYGVIQYSVSDKAYVYSDSTNAIMVQLSYNSSYRSTDIYVDVCADRYINSWPTAGVAGAVTSLGGGAGVAIPEPSFSWNCGQVYNNVATYGFYELDLMTIANDGTLVDTVDQYGAELDASEGWTRDGTSDRWISSDNSISITLSFNPYYGIEIQIRAYSAS